MPFLSFSWRKKDTSFNGRRPYPERDMALWEPSFRTSTFRNDLGKTFYLEARRWNDGEWDVTRMESWGSLGDPQQSLEKKEQSFFAAMDYLALMEATHSAAGYGLADEAEKEQLGYSHYEAFGRREGIVFDRRGLPHQTLDGLITIEGDFDPQAILETKRDYRPASERLKDIFAASVRDLQLNESTHYKFHSFIDALGAAKIHWNDGLKQGFGDIPDGYYQQGFADYDYTSGAGPTYRARYINFYTQAQTNLSHAARLMGCNKNIKDSLNILCFALSLSRESWLAQQQDSRSLRRAQKKETKEYLAALKGLPGATVSVEGLKNHERCALIDDFLAALRPLDAWQTEKEKKINDEFYRGFIRNKKIL